MEPRPPEPDPRGYREPPRRDPPTAVGVATPEPEPEPRRSERAGVLSSLAGVPVMRPFVRFAEIVQETLARALR